MLSNSSVQNQLSGLLLNRSGQQMVQARELKLQRKEIDELFLDYMEETAGEGKNQTRRTELAIKRSKIDKAMQKQKHKEAIYSGESDEEEDHSESRRMRRKSIRT